jgi:hypothetical protein
MLRTRLSFLDPAVDARTQGVDSDDSSRTSSNTTNGTTSTLLSDYRTAIFNREGAGNNSQISAGSIASIDYLTVTAITRARHLRTPPRRTVGTRSDSH